MRYREATVEDIEQLQEVRQSVRENVLSDPSRVTVEDYKDYLTRRGKGWVCEEEGKIVGFAIADVQENNIWALFLRPEYEKRGIGKALHQLMLDWYFSKKSNPVWLSTEPKSRAEGFYRKQGWQQNGLHENGEVGFIMTLQHWKELCSKKLR